MDLSFIPLQPLARIIRSTCVLLIWRGCRGMRWISASGHIVNAYISFEWSGFWVLRRIFREQWLLLFTFLLELAGQFQLWDLWDVQVLLKIILEHGATSQVLTWFLFHHNLLMQYWNISLLLLVFILEIRLIENDTCSFAMCFHWSSVRGLFTLDYTLGLLVGEQLLIICS